jgi:dienelactone hydrolase
VCVLLVALILSSVLCSAQTPTPTPPPCGSNTEATNGVRQDLDSAFQPSVYDSDDMTVLRRERFRPSGAGPFPTVIMIPPELYREDVGPDGNHSERVATKDLNDAGFLVFQVEHRLAPPNTIHGQDDHDRSTEEGIASGRPPQQTDDIKQQILAALADTECNQKIYIIGGSSGGAHTAWVALDGTAGNIIGWTPEVRAKIKAVVCLSGLFDLGTRQYGTVGPDFDPAAYVNVIENYTNTHTVDQPYGIQEAASAMSLVANATLIPAFRFYATDDDTIPPQQAVDMQRALSDRGVDAVEYTIPGSSAHCFNQWRITNTFTGECVGAEIIAFLQSYL